MHRALFAALLSSAGLVTTHANDAFADDPPTAHAAGAFEGQAAAPANAAPTVRDTRLRMQAGASLATGNTESFAGNVAGRFLLRRGLHQFTLDGVVNYGRASVLPMGAPMGAMRVDTTTAENYLLRARYDLFVTANNAFYLSAQAFRDQPSGFNSRFSGQIGYLRNIVNVTDRRRFWFEVGYDLSYENLTQADSMGRLERTINSARGFLGYEEKASSLLNLTAGLEGLVDVTNPGDFRLNGTVGFASRISDDFSLALTFTARYLAQPVGDHQALDTTTLVSVIFQRSLEPIIAAPPPPPPAPAPAGGAP